MLPKHDSSVFDEGGLRNRIKPISIKPGQALQEPDKIIPARHLFVKKPSLAALVGTHGDLAANQVGCQFVTLKERDLFNVVETDWRRFWDNAGQTESVAFNSNSRIGTFHWTRFIARAASARVTEMGQAAT